MYKAVFKFTRLFLVRFPANRACFINLVEGKLKTNDKYTSITGAVLGLYFAYEGYRLKLGTMHNPRSGFFIFYAGIVLSGLSVALLIHTFYSKSEERKILWKGRQWTKGAKLMLALFVYVLIFRLMGFFLSTFFLLLFLFKGLEPQRWRVAFMLTIITIALCYLIFGVFLEFQFPGGILEKMVSWLH